MTATIRPLVVLWLAANGFLCPGARAEAPPLQPESGYAAATARAKRDGRLVFVMFKQKDCPHCEKFTAKVLDAPEFREFARDHLALVIYDLDRSGSLSKAEQSHYNRLFDALKVKSTPTIGVFAPDGDRILRTQGYAGTPASRIVAQLRAKLP
ncbi:MAG: thioredoxin family protein [Akkermansiaceae bacterium]|nr:thioredoxin family protein [Akkermansiaceae bacterium]MCP5550471.1 thioredoxin family protein [Akkermansiaceae bacterium]